MISFRRLIFGQLLREARLRRRSRDRWIQEHEVWRGAWLRVLLARVAPQTWHLYRRTGTGRLAFVGAYVDFFYAVLRAGKVDAFLKLEPENGKTF